MTPTLVVSTTLAGLVFVIRLANWVVVRRREARR
jgi:hypothetical protein